jgi:hypothetical protein
MIAPIVTATIMTIIIRMATTATTSANQFTAKFTVPHSSLILA